MKVVTFNIRCDYGQDGENNFACRKPLILKKLSAERPDIICFQEVLPHVQDWLRENLREYYVLGCGRGEYLDDEQMTIAFRPEKYNLIQMDTFWMSETPFVPASRYPEQSICPRVSTCVLLEERTSKKVFRVLNTHLDHMGAQARKRGLKQALSYLEGARLFPDAPIVLCGDFNEAPDGPALKAFDDFPGYTNASSGMGITFHGFMREPAEAIDYIFLKGGIACKKISRWTDRENGVWLSDHYPVCAELQLCED